MLKRAKSCENLTRNANWAHKPAATAVVRAGGRRGIRGRMGGSDRMHQRAADTYDCAYCHHCAHMDTTADLDTHDGTDMDTRTNLDSGPDLHSNA